MDRYSIPAETSQTLSEWIANSDSIILTCHKSPDGDAIGSTMGLCLLLRHIGKQATVVVPNAPARNLLFLPGAQDIIVYAPDNADNVRQRFEQASLIFCMDFNDASRAQDLGPLIEQSPAHKVMVDHHESPKKFCDITISAPKLSSTCELTYLLINSLGAADKLGKEGASFLYMGIVTDTGNFAYNSSRPQTLLTAAALLEYGIDKDDIYRRAYNCQSENSLRLHGYALSRALKVKQASGVGLIVLRRDTLQKYFYTNGDTEGLVNKPLKIPGVFWTVFMREDDTCIKISMRSIGTFSVRRLCELYFGGGGHDNAAAGEFHGTMDEALNAFYTMLLKEKENIIKYKETHAK